MNANQSRLFMSAFVALFVVLVSGYYWFERRLQGCFLSSENMAQRFGSQTLGGFAEFRSLEQNKRTSFVWDLIEHKKGDYIGKSPDDLKSILGQSDGFFNNPLHPNYLISDPTQPSAPWTLVFALTTQNTVREAFVWRKSCKVSN